MLPSKEEVPLLVDKEQRFDVADHIWQDSWDKRNGQTPSRRVKRLPWSLQAAIWCTIGISLVLLLVSWLFWTKPSSLGSEISIRRPPKTLPGWPPKHNPAYLIHASHGAAATENIICSETAVDVLKAGGNAVDASIAATLCIGVVNMFRYCPS